MLNKFDVPEDLKDTMKAYFCHFHTLLETLLEFE